MSNTGRVAESPSAARRHWGGSGLAIGALASALVAAYGADLWLEGLRERVATDLNVLPVALVSAGLPILFAAVILALAWSALILQTNRRTIGFVYLIGGGLIVGAYATQFTGFPTLLRQTILGQFRNSIMALGAGSNLYRLASAWIVIGAVALIRRRSIST